MTQKISYSSAGVDIANADKTKEQMAESLETDNPLVLNRIGAFSSLCDGSFPEYKHPVLVCKMEEPGSKQILAFKYKKTKGICDDLINHLVNDVMVMGAHPKFVQDLIVCGKLEQDVVKGLVRDLASACKAQGAVLTGGETSEQPQVLEAGTYVLGASCIGVAEKDHIVDGSKICVGDIVLSLESSGPHTNGYTLIRALLKQYPEIAEVKVDGGTFIDAILTPHRCYYHTMKDLFTHPALHGMAHITGGGIPGNLDRILPKTMNAEIDASALTIPTIFTVIKEWSKNDDEDMIRTFNLGAGMTIVVDPQFKEEIIAHIQGHGVPCTEIGVITDGGSGTVEMKGALQWR
jgi:phosphoribosylformylglycinamidine cyclo-ligase